MFVVSFYYVNYCIAALRFSLFAYANKTVRKVGENWCIDISPLWVLKKIGQLGNVAKRVGSSHG